MQQRRQLLWRLLGRLASIGIRPADPEEVRVRKATLTLATITVSGLAFIWVGVYAALGLGVSAAIPLGYQIVSVVGLTAFARTGALEPFRSIQVLLILLLPFLLQWSLGGYAASSVVSLWALVGALGALLVYGARAAIAWFMAFVALSIISGAADAWLGQTPAAIPDALRILFFVLNVLGVSVTAFLLLQYFVRQREAELERSEGLLLNILPRPIAERLKREGRIVAESHPAVTVLFADVVDFTPFAERTPPGRVVDILDEIFSTFDALADRHGLEKIKTIGDAYMAVAGLPTARPDHAEAAADLALDMQAELRRLTTTLGVELQLRIGMASGPVIAGVIGRRKFIYDLWGDTVNTASRMESAGLPGRIQVTEATRDRLASEFSLESRGRIAIKGKGELEAFLLVGRRSTGGASGSVHSAA